MEGSERRKAIELLKEMRSENKEEDNKSSNQETCLNWIYKGPSDLVDKEEYLLGKAIDKTFEFLQSGGNSDIMGRIGEQSNIPKKVLEKTESTEQVDIAKKILEDPLYAIKQKEMEARKKLLNNPVKLKQIKQMLLERSKQISSKKRKKKKKKSEQDLNILIIKKLKKFSDKEKRKALNKIMLSNSSPSSTDISPKSKKHKSKQERHSSSDESDSSSDDAEECIKKRKSRKKKTKNKKIKESITYSDTVKEKKSKKKRSKKSFSSSESESSDSESFNSKDSQENENRKSQNPKVRRENDSGDRSRKNRNNERQEKDRRKKEGGRRHDSSAEDRKSRKTYGLMMPDGSKPEVKKRTSPIRKYQKNNETKAKYIPPPRPPKPFSEKERDEILKEMMKNAKLRKEDREKNLASHRRKQALEEETKTYDDDFMRRQMSQLTSQGTMADRIKSNINNIQRSNSSMETSFMQK